MLGRRRRAWRRPLTGDELERYTGIAASIGAESGSASEALRYALWGILQSPNFLYRVELGTASAGDGGRLGDGAARKANGKPTGNSQQARKRECGQIAAGHGCLQVGRNYGK